MVFVGVFALFHGHAHGTEMPHFAEPALYALGFSLATAVLHVVGAVTGYFSLRYEGGIRLLRLTGLLIAASGIYFVTQV
jgi:urease accessory protein